MRWIRQYRCSGFDVSTNGLGGIACKACSKGITKDRHQVQQAFRVNKNHHKMHLNETPTVPLDGPLEGQTCEPSDHSRANSSTMSVSGTIKGQKRGYADEQWALTPAAEFLTRRYLFQRKHYEPSLSRRF